MKLQTRSVTAALLILTVAVAACGGGSATSSSASQGQTGTQTQADAPGNSTASTASTQSINVCALITEPEATALLGSDPGPGTATDMGSATSPACAYGASLTFGVDRTGGKAKFDSDTSSMQGAANSHTLAVGDACAATIVANTVASMEILKGSTILTVMVQGDPTLQNITPAALTKLGTAAVGRL